MSGWWRRIEWQTVLVIVGTYAGLTTVLLNHDRLPAGVTVVLLGLMSTMHSSLQHEVIHRHPTPWQRVNEVLVWLPVGLTVPYERFRDSHREHHDNDGGLTDPLSDPESNYITPEQWSRAGRARRAWLWAQRMLAGRMLFGPIRSLTRFWTAECRQAMRAPGLASVWLRHLVGVVAVLGLVRIAAMPIWMYALGAGYVAMMLIALRSFAEHRAVPEGTRSAVVRTGPFFRLLYLNNSLHHTHHARPAVAWYRLHAAADELGSDEVAAAGAGLYRGGYREIARRYMFRPLCQPVNPLLEPNHEW